MDHELNAGMVMLILHVFIPAQSSVKAKIRGETVVGILVDQRGERLVIVGFWGVLKENEDTVPTWIIELAERIVIDYTNLSGRADNRPQFRGNVIKHLLNYTARPNNLINKETKCCMGGCGDINCKHC